VYVPLPVASPSGPESVNVTDDEFTAVMFIVPLLLKLV
jgi:hypothetical protein